MALLQDIERLGNNPPHTQPYSATAGYDARRQIVWASCRAAGADPMLFSGREG